MHKIKRPPNIQQGMGAEPRLCTDGLADVKSDPCDTESFPSATQRPAQEEKGSGLLERPLWESPQGSKQGKLHSPPAFVRQEVFTHTPPAVFVLLSKKGALTPPLTAGSRIILTFQLYQSQSDIFGVFFYCIFVSSVSFV